MMSRIYKIGFDERNDIVVEHDSIADFHAEIYLDPEKNCYFTDLKTTTGSKVNGKRVYTSVILESGDKLELGNGQYFDWELTFFNRKPGSALKQIPENKEISKKQVDKSLEDSFVKRNMDLILIYGGIVFFLILLNFIL